MKSLSQTALHAGVWAITFVGVSTLGFTGLAYAATNGGLFGDVLNKILASGDWKNPGDGTVKNAEKLNNINAGDFVRFHPSNPSATTCQTNQCVTGLKPDTDHAGFYMVDCK